MARSDKLLTEAPTPALTSLQQQWATLWTCRLPQHASQSNLTVEEGSDPAWPVWIDYSLARVLLDNVVGQDRPWSSVIDSPATLNMSEKQLRACIELGEKLLSNEKDVKQLYNRSQRIRGARLEEGQVETISDVPDKAKSRVTRTLSGQKRKRCLEDGRDSSPPSFESKKDVNSSLDTKHQTKQTSKQLAAEGWSLYSLKSRDQTTLPEEEEEAEMRLDVQCILLASDELTPFKRHALLLLTQVPRGRFTTYQAIADAMGRGNGRSVGEAMRTNPFAPTVPCHRMLSSDAKIGGFHGDWETDGGFYRQKRRLLEEEGVLFDEKDRAIGKPFNEFTPVRIHTT